MRILIAIFTWSSVALAAAACSLCTSPVNRATFGEGMDSASVVVVGRLSNPRLNPNPIAGAGAGSTDLAVDKVLKNDGSVQGGQTVTLPTYMPVPDPKQPPVFLVYFERFRDRLTVSRGIAVNSQALFAYLENARAERAKGRVAALVYYAQFLDHADEAIALDAFVEFAKSKDADVGKAATLLDPKLVRRLLAAKDVKCDKLSLYAFFLGCCGQDRDADELLKIMNGLAGENVSAMDGCLAGYLTLRPRDGWAKLATLLSDPKQPFNNRFAGLRAVRMLQGWRGAEIKSEALAAYKHVIRDRELADFAVEDLRRWQWWELTADIAAQLGQPTFRAPILQHCLIRYAVWCPLPEGRAMAARARQIEPEYVEDQEREIAELRGR